MFQAGLTRCETSPPFSPVSFSLASRPVPKAGLTLWDGFSLDCVEVSLVCKSAVHYETPIEGLGTTFVCSVPPQKALGLTHLYFSITTLPQTQT